MNYFVDTHVTQMRRNVQVGTGIPIQIDLMSQQEASFYGGAAPYLRYEGMIAEIAGLDIRAKDLLVDPASIDVDTNAPTAYRVVSQQVYPDLHWELVLDKARGTT